LISVSGRDESTQTKGQLKLKVEPSRPDLNVLEVTGTENRDESSCIDGQANSGSRIELSFS